MLRRCADFKPNIFRAFLVSMLAIVLVACGGGGGSNVGSQSDSAPFASAQVVGVSATTTGTVTARSGSEVLLTGKESDGIDDPILQFNWRQIDTSGIVVDLEERTSNSKSFAAPRVAQPTNLQFELTVVDSNGKSATDTVVVTVLPGTDSNVFLLQDAATDPSVASYQFVVAVEPGEVTNSAFSLDIETVVDWIDRTGAPQSIVIDQETINGEWPEGVEGEEDVASAYFNPRYIRPLPVIDVDEINNMFEGEDSRDKRLETRDIDKAEIYIRFRVNFSDNNARIALVFPDDSTKEVLTTATGQMVSELVHVDELRERADLETRSSAAKYYALINAPETLSQWLAQSGFTADPENQPDVAHAKYLNNYDLGFGRDMYLRVDEDCGNVYSFVGNYPTLENTLQNRNQFATVVMEYSPIDGACSGEKIVKFMNYVPDERSGEQVLVKSMNFDGRGEKFVPGVCTVCHGGAPRLADLAGKSLVEIADMDEDKRLEYADLDTSFLPWDLDSFLYADDDPAMTPDRSKVSDADRQKHSRASQEAQFKAMNQGTLLTYLDKPVRYAASIELVHGWYGLSNCSEPGADVPRELTPGATFNGDFVQCGWQSDPALYQQVFAQHCRACHTNLVEPDRNFDTVAEFLENANLDDVVFDSGTMPLARLTYDRFRAPFVGGTSAASVLDEVRTDATFSQTDLPIPRFSLPATDPDAGTAVTLDGSRSRFADSYNWSLESTNSECSQVPALVGANSAFTAFVVGESGCRYKATLTATNAAGSASLSQEVRVKDKVPVAVPITVAYQPEDGALRIEVLSEITDEGDGSLQLLLNEGGAAFNPNVTNNGDGSLSYQTLNPFADKFLDEVQYQLRDANGSLSDQPGVITVNITPVVPELVADGSPTAVDLRWSVDGAIPITGFNVFRGDSEDSFVLLTTTAGGGTRQYRDQSVAPNQTYFYQLSALSGEFESLRSSVVQAKTVENPLKGVSASALSATRIRVVWNNVSGAIRYLIQDGTGAAIDTVPAGAGNFYDHEMLVPATLYRYRVIADFGGGDLTDFVSTQATTLAVPQPGNVMLTKNCNTPGTITVEWDAVAESESYTVTYNDAEKTVIAPATTTTVDVDTNSLVNIGVEAVIGSKSSTTGSASITSCVSWETDIFPEVSTVNCASGDCHDAGSNLPLILPGDITDEDNLYLKIISSPGGGPSCFFDDTCSSSMDGAVQNFLDAGGVTWGEEGALNN